MLIVQSIIYKNRTEISQLILSRIKKNFYTSLYIFIYTKQEHFRSHQAIISTPIDLTSSLLSLLLTESCLDNEIVNL